MRTTLDLPDETFRQLKAQAALRGLKLKELVAQLIQRGLAAGANAPLPEQQATAMTVALVPTYPIPIAREADGTVTPYLRNATRQRLRGVCPPKLSAAAIVRWMC